MYIQKVLSNGIRVAAEKIPYVKSVSLGVWIGNGSRYERKEENGMSHFIEHMLFKGTYKRTAEQIALEMDSVGAQLNAFTTRENTCFYAKILNEYVDTAIDILSDMLFEPKLSAEDMRLERRVICEEIAMYEDSPEDVAYDMFGEAVWGDSPMGRTILGTPESLQGITPDKMREYMNTHYTSKNMVIALSGSFDDDIFDKLEKAFGERVISDKEVLYESVSYTAHDIFKERDFEQVQLIAGFNGIDVMDMSVYSLLVFNNVFGSGMSCRLFQNIREKYGLVYSIGAGHSAYLGTGTFDVSAATSRENAETVAELIVKEINDMKNKKLTEDEIERAKIQLKGNYILSGEHISARMQSLGRTVILNRPLKTQEQIIDDIMAVNHESVSEIIDRVMDISTLSVIAAGPISGLNGLFTF